MRELSWRSLGKVDVPANADVLWFCAQPDVYIEGPLTLRITASGEWQLDAQTKCGPNGSLKEGFSDTALLKTAPMGALIAKIGGSTTDKPNDGSGVFAVGGFCVIRIAAETRGALYFTMNDVVADFANHSGKLAVEISVAR